MMSFFAMQEIPFILKTDKFPESKLLVVEENMARALTLKWSDFNLAKAVSYSRTVRNGNANIRA